MKNRKNVLLGELVENHDNRRIPLSSSQREKIDKIYPYYGAQGVIDHVDKYLFDGEYILVAEDGENLKSQKQKICRVVSGKFWVNNHAHIIQASGKHNTRYLAYLLNLIDFKPYITGSAQPKLTKENLSQIKLRIHEPNEQQRIACFLTAIDTKIDLNNRINAELEGMAKLLYDYWFMQFDFPMTAAQATTLGNPQLAGKPYRSSGGKMVYNEVLKREIPEVWEAKSLSQLVPVTKESVNPADSPDKFFKLFSIPVFDATGTYFLEKGSYVGSNKFIVTGNNILVSKLNPWFSRVIYSPADIEAVCSTEFVVWQTIASWMKAFLFIVARSPQFVTFCTQSATGTSNSHKRVNPEVMMSHSIPWEPSQAQSFGEIVNSILLTRQFNEIQNKELAQLRDWLLPMLMNGQVTVNQNEPPRLSTSRKYLQGCSWEASEDD